MLTIKYLNFAASEEEAASAKALIADLSLKPIITLLNDEDNPIGQQKWEMQYNDSVLSIKCERSAHAEALQNTLDTALRQHLKKNDIGIIFHVRGKEISTSFALLSKVFGITRSSKPIIDAFHNAQQLSDHHNVDTGRYPNYDNSELNATNALTGILACKCELRPSRNGPGNDVTSITATVNLVNQYHARVKNLFGIDGGAVATSINPGYRRFAINAAALNLALRARNEVDTSYSRSSSDTSDTTQPLTPDTQPVPRRSSRLQELRRANSDIGTPSKKHGREEEGTGTVRSFSERISGEEKTGVITRSKSGTHADSALISIEDEKSPKRIRR